MIMTLHHHSQKLNASNVSDVADMILSKLKLGSWEHLEQIPTGTVTFVKATFVLAIFVHIRNISGDWILTQFKVRLLGPSLTDANCHDNICPGNICPCDICTY